ncbi:MAG: FtsQ-type POTRA domain-containing protein [Pseudomonadota bacterium]
MAQRGNKRGGKKGAKPASLKRVSPLKPGLRGASRLVQSRVQAGMRAAGRSPASVARATGTVLAALFFLALTALWLGGHLSAVRDSLNDYKRDRLMAMGFTVERIDVTGEGRLSEADVRAAVGIYEGDYFFGTDLERAQANTESLPWVDRAVVRRLWPNRIVVQLVETTPYALHQRDGVLYLAARDGELISRLDPEAGQLPDDIRLFIGEDAVAQSDAVTVALQRRPDIWARTEVLTRQASGRWDVTLKGGTVLRLPADRIATALSRYAALSTRTDMARFAVVDLRLHDRMTMTPAKPAEA